MRFHIHYLCLYMYVKPILYTLSDRHVKINNDTHTMPTTVKTSYIYHYLENHLKLRINDARIKHMCSATPSTLILVLKFYFIFLK